MEDKLFINAFGNLKTIKSKKWGEYKVFIPKDLPPEIEFNKRLVLALSNADSTLSKLSGAALLLPNPDLLITPYLKKEALSSSRIEGTQISLSNYFLAEARGEEENDPDASEVSNYIKSVNWALEEIKTKQITLDLIKNMHRILMNQVRGEDKLPGKYRPIQNWIGLPNSNPNNAIFVPPPPEDVERLLSNMLDYLNSYDELPILIKCALMHYHFETIHPFCDGNGRIGRALITLYLCKKKKISKPILYLSGFFEKYKGQYNSYLAETNQRGNFENWLLFFLEGIRIQSEEALTKSIEIQKLKEKYRGYLQKKSNIVQILEVVDKLFINPYVQINNITKILNCSYPKAKRIVELLIEHNILKEQGKAERNKTYIAHEILDLINDNL